MGVKQTVPELFKDTKREWIIGARITARNLLREKPWITIEDVLAVWPLPKYLHRNTIGQVFKDSTVFQRVGWMASRRPISNGRYVRRWALRYEDKDEEGDCE